MFRHKRIYFLETPQQDGLPKGKAESEEGELFVFRQLLDIEGDFGEVEEGEVGNFFESDFLVV